MMSSFVSAVLTSAGQLEIQEATAKLQQLSKRSDQLKSEIFELTTTKYEDFAPKFTSTERVVEEVAQVKQDIEEVSSRIENQIKSHLNVSTGEFQSLRGQLEDVTCLMVVMEKLANLHDGLEVTKTAVLSSEYAKAADAVLQVKALLSEKVHDRENEVNILQSIHTECQIQIETLITELLEKWKQLVEWVIPEKAEKESSMENVELRLNVLADNTNVLNEVVMAMRKLNILDCRIKEFGNRLQTHVLETLIKQAGCVIRVQETARSRILVVVCESEREKSPPPQVMFANLAEVFKFLNGTMLQTVVEEGEPPVTLMSLLGRFISGATLDLMVKECLIPAIPSCSKDLEQFAEVIGQTEKVNKALLDMGFIAKDVSSLVDFVQNVNVLFANKKCQEILERARKLMTTDVHNTVVVSHEKPLGDLPSLAPGLGGSKKMRREELIAETPIRNTFKLPTCHISTSIQELMSLAYETLHEATESSPQCAVQMFFACRNMFELFCSVFTTYHRQSLETLPQFSALHYNNCMFISHHLMTLGHQFIKKLPSNINATLVDLVPKIRRLGTGCFLQQQAKQKELMSEYMSGANGFLSVSEKESFLSAERAVKQTLHQLTHLSKVWRDVLHPSNYRKAIGSLLNGIIIELVDSVLSLEDISADDTKQLSHLINSMVKSAEEVFLIPGEDSNINVELQRNVQKWQRFKELDMILNASMIDIEDRWASGKGPLAVSFSADEVKQLIRALFQNTDRRSAVLSKIK